MLNTVHIPHYFELMTHLTFKNVFSGEKITSKHIYLYVKLPALLARALVLRENNVFGTFDERKIIPGISYAP